MSNLSSLVREVWQELEEMRLDGRQLNREEAEEVETDLINILDVIQEWSA